MAALASAAAVRPQHTNMQILNQLRETALWHDPITQELPSSLGYHVEIAYEHLHQAYTHRKP